jgi:DNA-binding GntR family transcriptional regulator
VSLNVKRKGLAGRAYLIVKQRVLRGELAVGQTISRRKLAAELGISIAPATEALMRLELEGLLESRPRAGTRVRIPTEEALRGQYAVREALEVQAARLFVDHATREEKTELMRLAIRVDSLSQAPATGRVALSDAIERAHALTSMWNCAGQHCSEDRTLRKRHEQLIVALSNGLPALAERAMRAYIRGDMERTIARFQSFFASGEEHGSKYVRSDWGGPLG